MYHKFDIVVPPLPAPLTAFDCLPVYALNNDHPLCIKYMNIIEKLRDNNDRPPFTLLSLPDIYYIKSNIDQEDLPVLHSFVRSYFYGILHGHSLHYAGPGLLKIAMDAGSRAWDAGYLYLEYDEHAEICPEIFGLYGMRFCGLYTRGAWVPRCTNVTQPLLDIANSNIALLGRVTVVSYTRDNSSKGMRALCDLRENSTASVLELCPEHPIAN